MITARDRTGRTIQRSEDAPDQRTLVQKMRNAGYFVTSIEEKKAKRGAVSIPFLGGKKKVGLKHVAIFSRQFATMVDAGLPVISCLNILIRQTENKTLSEIVSEVKVDIESGSNISGALSKHPEAFSDLYINLVKAGEVGGVLDKILDRVSVYLEKDLELRNKVKSAMFYPVMVLGAVFAITAFLIVFIVPIFAKMFKQFGGELPLPTRVLLSLSDFVKSYWWVIILAAIIANSLYKRYYATKQGRLTIDRLKLRLPVFGPLASKISCARFSRTLGLLIASGVPILESLDITSKTAGNEVVARAIVRARTSIKEGEDISGPLERSGVFPPMLTSMMAVGETTGRVDSMLEKVADFYEDEVDNTVDGLASMIEPILIVILGVIVGGVLIAMYLPVFQMAAQIG